MESQFTIDRKLNFEAQTLKIIDYIKKYLHPLRYLVKLGLSDHLSRQFAMTIRCKIVYGIHWIFKIPKTHLETLELWWCNTLRAYLGARRRLSRSYLFAGAGLPKIENYANYILVKRAFHWASKKLTDRPFLPISEILKSVSTQHKTHTMLIRPPTSQTTPSSLFKKRQPSPPVPTPRSWGSLKNTKLSSRSSALQGSGVTARSAEN